jgi:hypothetical protein
MDMNLYICMADESDLKVTDTNSSITMTNKSLHDFDISVFWVLIMEYRQYKYLLIRIEREVMI